MATRKAANKDGKPSGGQVDEDGSGSAPVEHTEPKIVHALAVPDGHGSGIPPNRLGLTDNNTAVITVPAAADATDVDRVAARDALAKIAARQGGYVPARWSLRDITGTGDEVPRWWRTKQVLR